MKLLDIILAAYLFSLGLFLLVYTALWYQSYLSDLAEPTPPVFVAEIACHGHTYLLTEVLNEATTNPRQVIQELCSGRALSDVMKQR